MPIEDSLRTQLHREADAVLLPDREPGRAVDRARTRRRRRRAGAGVVAVVALVAVAAGVVPALGGDDDETADVAAGVGDVLPATGPLAFDWQAADGGLSGVSSSFETADGTLYALSTAPGFRPGEPYEWPRALYRLADDGTWQPIDLEAGDRPSAIDMADNGDALYAVSTGPGAAGESVPQLSASTDGGETWAIEDVPTVAPPNEDLTWFQDRYLTVETAGDTTIALVTTSFRLDVAASFPELADHAEFGVSEDGVIVSPVDIPGMGADAAGRLVAEEQVAAAGGAEVEPRAASEGATVVGVDPADAPPDVNAPPPEDDSWTSTTMPPAGGPIAGPDGGPVEEGLVPPHDGERTLTWAELGLAGPEDLAPTYQVARNTGSGWEQVDATGLAGDFLTLGTAGDRFIAEGGPMGGAPLVSDDGATWTPVTPPAEEAGEVAVGSVGPALVAVGTGTGNLYTSTDVGASWQRVDTAGLGVPAGSYVASMDTGPLGVAIVTVDPDAGESRLVVSGDLVDWTATPITDIVGDAPSSSEVTVGAERIVVTSTLASTGEGPSESRTAIGTLVRD